MENGNRAMEKKFKKMYSVLYRLTEGACGEMPPLTGVQSEEGAIRRRSEDLKRRFPAEWMFAMEKVRSSGGGGRVVGPFGPDDVKKALATGKRVTLLIRHAERPPLDPSDTSFGEALPVTDFGMETAIRFGEVLAGAAGTRPVQVFCSRTLRTIQTGCGISEGLGLAALPVIDDVLGSGSPFFGPLGERMELIAEGRYLERLNEYFVSGTQRGYRPLGSSTGEMEERIQGFHREPYGVVVAVTHDVNVASFLAGRGVAGIFDESTWPGYLDAAVITEDMFGGREYGMMRSRDALSRGDLKREVRAEPRCGGILV